MHAVRAGFSHGAHAGGGISHSYVGRKPLKWRPAISTPLKRRLLRSLADHKQRWSAPRGLQLQ